VIGVILTSVIFVQFKTIGQTDISELQSMSDNELKTDIADLKAKYDEGVKAIADTNKSIAEYQSQISSGKSASALLQQELKKSNDLTGKNAAAGPGVVVTLADSSKKIKAFDILDLINDLKGAGAEAISVNDQRIVYNSYIVDIDNGFISVGGGRLISPYIVKAIGDANAIYTTLSDKQYGYIDTETSAGKSAALQKQDNINIPAYVGSLDFNYAKEAK